MGTTHSDVRHTPSVTQEFNPGANEDGAKGSRHEQKDGGKSKQDSFISGLGSDDVSDCSRFDR